MRLMRVCWFALPAVFVAMATAAPVRADQLALQSSSPSRILLDLQRREISVVLDGRMRGSWPVAIGDPKTPTPQGQFSTLKKINPFYFPKSPDKVRSSLARRVQLVIAICPSTAMLRVNSVSTELTGPITCKSFR